MKKLIIFLLLVVIAIGISVFLFPAKFGASHALDRTAPELTVELVKSPAYAVKISARDELTSLTDLKLEAVQNGKSISLPAEEYLHGENASLSITYPPKKISENLKEGEVTLNVSISDSSYWKNSATQSLSFTIDKRSPRLDILSQQHRMFAGGSELVVYTVREENLAETGVLLGDMTFCAVPLNTFSGFEDASSTIYVSLFAAPLDMTGKDFSPHAYAKDSYGNTTKLPLRMRYDPKKVPEASPSISRNFLERKIPPLLEESTLDYPDAFTTATAAEDTDDETWISYFKTINEKYRLTLRNSLKSILTDGTRCTPLIPTEQMTRPLQGSLMSGFGEQRYYKYNGADAGFSVHEGFDLASVRNDDVVATGSGTVLLAEEFGIYGNAVLIDHGLGLSSLYGHLSSIQVEVGQKVQEGQKIAQSGETGLAGGDHLHFELRVGFVPVTPIEWWDPKWFTDNITGKLSSFAKKSDEETTSEEAQ